MTVDDLDLVDWDDAVDIVCVGPGPAALAAAVGAAAAGFEVLLVADRAERSGQVAAFLDGMTADFQAAGSSPRPGPLPVRDAAGPQAPALPKHVSFSGPALFDWATACLESPCGLLCTTATAAAAGPLRVGVVHPADAADLDGWLAVRAAELDIHPEPRTELRDLVVIGGTVTGAVLGGPDGEALVRADCGVVIATGTADALAPQDLDRPAELVVCSLPYSRFARLELLVGQDVARS